MATSITIEKGVSWLDLPMNVDSLSSIELDRNGDYQLTGFLGLLIADARKNGVRHDLAVIAVSDPLRGIVYAARHSAGYGQHQVISRMPISAELFSVICACACESSPDLLPAELRQISIIVAPNSFIPTFLKAFVQ